MITAFEISNHSYETIGLSHDVTEVSSGTILDRKPRLELIHTDEQVSWRVESTKESLKGMWVGCTLHHEQKNLAGLQKLTQMYYKCVKEAFFEHINYE